MALALHVSGIRLALLALALTPLESDFVNIPGYNRRIISRQNQPNRIVANKKKKNVAAAGDLTHEAAFATPRGHKLRIYDQNYDDDQRRWTH